MLTFDQKNDEIQINDHEMVSFISDIYRETRYLERLSDMDLKARMHGLISFLIKIDTTGRPHLIIDNGPESIAFIDILEESRLRKIDLGPIIGSYICKCSCSFRKNEISSIQQKLKKLHGKKCLYKFTKTKYANAFLNGNIRFKTASSYNNEGYNIAIKDDELNLDHVLRGIQMVIQDGTKIPIDNDKITVSAVSDYYVSCFSDSFDFKFFALFECDCCIIICNAGTFVDSVLQSYRKTYSNYFTKFGAVVYIDQYRQLPYKRPMEFTKSWNYSFEKEYRFVSIPLNKYESLEEIQFLSIDPSEIEFQTVEISDKKFA